MALGDLYSATLSGNQAIESPPISTFISALNEQAVQIGQDISYEYNTADESSQAIPADIVLGTAAGSTAPDSSYLAGVMGNALSDAPLTKTGNIIGGVIGKYNISANASTHPSAGVVAEIGEDVNDATNTSAVRAVLGGDSGTTIAQSFYGVASLNSTAASGTHFGLDLQAAAIGAYLPVDRDFYLSAPLRLVNDVCILVGSGAPVDGTTGDNVCGPGSLYIDIAAGNAYLQTSLVSTPVWKLVTRAA